VISPILKSAMAAGGSTTQIIDSYIEQLFAGWSIYSSLLTVIFVAYLLYPLFFGKEPDTHPLLLARQATPTQIRQPGESAIYRSLDAPHGYPLRSGLNVKDAEAPKWTSGRDGELRDVWKKALEGVDGRIGHIISVMGKETCEHKLADLTGHINGIGKYIQKQDAKRVAIYLPNSVEFLVAFFGMYSCFCRSSMESDLVFCSCRILWLYTHSHPSETEL